MNQKMVDVKAGPDKRRHLEGNEERERREGAGKARMVCTYIQRRQHALNLLVANAYFTHTPARLPPHKRLRRPKLQG